MRKRLLKLLSVFFFLASALSISSCYYDYGVDTSNSDIVITLRNPDYNFQGVTKYRLIDSVVQIGGDLTHAYDNTIISSLRSNLNALGWLEVQDSVGAGIVSVAAGITKSTYTVSYGSDWWYYWGYYWYYPPYYSYTYTYTTGTVVALITDLNLASSGKAPVQWSATMNGIAEAGGSVSARISAGINQAFTQSPYLK